MRACCGFQARHDRMMSRHAGTFYSFVSMLQVVVVLML